ncbi:MoaD/ThiS family protein [candidate division KSB1 bacterium]|nr:MoaD/ThiS family protein [candidate division KSB1 bacterium]
MKIAVLLFASLRDAVGASRLELEAPAESTPRQIAELLAAGHHHLKPHLKTIAFAIDGEFVAGDAKLAEVKELALLPPVSGG